MALSSPEIKHKPSKSHKMSFDFSCYTSIVVWSEYVKLVYFFIGSFYAIAFITASFLWVFSICAILITVIDWLIHWLIDWLIHASVKFFLTTDRFIGAHWCVQRLDRCMWISQYITCREREAGHVYISTTWFTTS